MDGAVVHLRRPDGRGLAESTACGVRIFSDMRGEWSIFAWHVTCSACIVQMTEQEISDRWVDGVKVEREATVDVDRTVDDGAVMAGAVPLRTVEVGPGRMWIVPEIPRLLGEVVVETGGRRRILFDGEELPWHVAEGGVSIVPEIGGLSRVVVEFLVERARVVDELEDGAS